MTTYNTGNALGSSDARDLYDNAENIDSFANGAANTYKDRLGVTRKSIAGMQNAFDDFIESSGYTVPVSYASGIVLSVYNQLIEYNDEFYKLKAGQAPYTTTGTWGTDSAKLVAVGDAALRHELTSNANDFNLLPEIGNYAALRAYAGDVTAYYVRGVANIFDGGAGVFRVDAADTTTADDNYFVIVDSSGRRWKREKNYLPAGPGAVAMDVQARLRELNFEADYASVADAINAAVSLSRRIAIKRNITVRIPTDCPTLQVAVDRLVPLYPQVTIVLNIEAGHQPASGIYVENGDYSQFRITSTDAEVTLSPSFAFASSFVHAYNAAAPRLACLVNASNRCTNGYYLQYKSTGFVEELCGVKNCANSVTEGAGLFLNGSCSVVARKSIFTGSYRNIWVAHESTCYADFATADGATGDTGVYSARASLVGISYGSAKNCAGNGLRARRARLLCMAVDASGNGTGGAGYGIQAVECSEVIASQGAGDVTVGANLSNCKQGAINCDASIVVARNSNLNTGANSLVASNAVSATQGSLVNVTSSTMNASVTYQQARGINAATGSTVIASSSNISNCTAEGIRALFARVDASFATIATVQRGISASQASQIDAGAVTITSASVHGVLSQEGSIVRVEGGSVTGSTTTDLRIEQGGQIQAHGCTTTGGGAPTLGNTNAPVSFNAIGQQGIIWA